MPESKSSSSGVLDRLDEESSRWDLPYAIRNTMIDAAAEIRRLQAVEAAHANLRQVHDDLSRRESGLYNAIIAIAKEVGVYWGNTGDDDDDCASGSERWVRLHFPDGSGLIFRGQHCSAGWVIGCATVDEDKPVPSMVCEQRKHTMAFVFTAPAGTKFVLWSGAFDRKVVP